MRVAGKFRLVIGFVVAGLLAGLMLSCGTGTEKGREQVQKSARSNDGTTIAYERSGEGPVVIVVAAALADRSGTTRLARHLAEHFTVINYDRRGRGKSGDTRPYAVGREVEDIEALIDGEGGSVFLFGSSSGSVLALEATSRLGPKVRKLYMYEPPFIVDGSHPPIQDNLMKEIDDLVVAGERNDAVKIFFAKGMGIPGLAVTMMRWLMPGWSKMAGMAHTLRYDLTILDGTQLGRPLDAQRWASASAPTLVVVGSKSEPFFHSGAKALVQILPKGQYGVLEGRDHSAILFATQALADSAAKFFLAKKD